jgi:tRNA pseudouridine55 synthase
MPESSLTTPSVRGPRRPVHGVLLLDKPEGRSSHAAVQKVRYLLRAQKAGHTGTLDPFASGVLPICLGAATKFARFYLEADKAYEARIQLGVRTDTGDREGQVIDTCPVNRNQIDRTALADLAARWVGVINQIPPMYSALKKDGKPLYAYAREGQTVVREPRAVHIHTLKLDWAFHAPDSISPSQTQGTSPDQLTMKVHCGKGTYIRTLAEDIGLALGCGAHVQALQRTATGAWTIEHCVSLAALEAMTEAQRLACLRPIDSLVQTLPPWHLNAAQAARLLTGQRLRGESQEEASWHAPMTLWRVYGPDGAFLGVAHSQAGELIPQRLLSPLEVAQARA